MTYDKCNNCNAFIVKNTYQCNYCSSRRYTFTDDVTVLTTYVATYVYTPSEHFTSYVIYSDDVNIRYIRSDEIFRKILHILQNIVPESSSNLEGRLHNVLKYIHKIKCPWNSSPGQKVQFKKLSDLLEEIQTHCEESLNA